MEYFSYKLFMSVLLLLLPISSLSAHNSSIYQLICNKNFTTTNNNNILRINIKNTISSLVAHTSNTTFAMSSYGIGFDSIYGLFQCRGDTGHELCSSCIMNAVHQIRTFCPYSVETRVWFEFCFLRHDNYNFFGQADSSYTRVWPSELSAENSDQSFNSALGWLLDAAKGSAVGKDVKTGRTITDEENSNRTLYGLAQCTRDLDESGCSYCLQKALEIMAMDCKNRLGCALISNCCMFRYEIYNLFVEAETPNPGTAVSALSFNGNLH